MAKRIFILGGAGFIGRHFIDRCSRGDDELFVLSRRSDHGFREGPALRVLTGDISEIDKFDDVLSSCHVLVHLAGEKYDEDKMEEVNVNSMRKIVSVMNRNPGLKLIYVSSCGVYGIYTHPEEVITESSLCFPDSNYERTKYAAETILSDQLINDPGRYVILRPSNVIGMYDKAHKLTGLIGLIKRKLFFSVDSKAMVNYVPADFVSEIMSGIIEQNAFDNEVYNVNVPMQLEHLAGFVQKESGMPVVSRHMPKSIAYLLCLLSEVLPRKYRKLSLSRYRSMSNRRIYSAEKLKSRWPFDGEEILEKELRLLLKSYEKEGRV